jgi:hypothetical protein
MTAIISHCCFLDREIKLLKLVIGKQHLHRPWRMKIDFVIWFWILNYLTVVITNQNHFNHLFILLKGHYVNKRLCYSAKASFLFVCPLLVSQNNIHDTLKHILLLLMYAISIDIVIKYFVWKPTYLWVYYFHLKPLHYVFLLYRKSNLLDTKKTLLFTFVFVWCRHGF